MWRVQTTFVGAPGAPYHNALYFDASTQTATGAAGAVDSFWGALDDVMHVDTDWTREAEVAEIDEVSGQLESLSTVASTSGNGAISTEAAPQVLQALIRWRTEVPFDGRLLQGRTNVPSLTVAGLEDGRLIGTQRLTIETAAAALIADSLSDLVVWRRPVFSDPPTDPPTIVRNGAFSFVVVAIVPDTLAVLRSRRD